MRDQIAPTPSAGPAGHGDFSARQLGRLADCAIRAAGFLGTCGSVAIFAWLYRQIHAVPSGQPALIDYPIAALGFLAASIGGATLVLGRHVNDRIPLAERWRRRI